MAAPSAAAEPLPSRTDGTAGHYDGEDSLSSGEQDSQISEVSHISLDEHTFRSLILAHLIALVPAVLFIIALTVLARFTPCRLHLREQRHPRSLGLLPPDDDHRSSLRCAAVLTDGLTSITVALGFVAWLAAYALRPICWSIAHFVTHINPLALLRTIVLPFSSRAPLIVSPESLVTSTTIVAILLRTIILEVLRLGSVGVSVALLAAEISRLHRVRPEDDDWFKGARVSFNRRMQLSPTDPRLSLALWCALGWAAAEIVVGTFQTFAQLRLYAPSKVDLTRAPYLAWTETCEDSNWGPIRGVEPSSDEDQADHESAGHERKSPQRYMTMLEEEAEQSMTPRVAPEPLSASAQLSIPSQSSREGAVPELPSITSSNNFKRYGATDDAAYRGFDSSISTSSSEVELDHALATNIDRLVTTHRRSELEAQIGLPLPEVPPTLVALWRADSVLFNIGATLFASAAWAVSQGPLYVRLYPIMTAASHERWRDEFHLDPPRLFPPFHRLVVPLIFLSVLHAVLSASWTLALPRLGFASVTYGSLLFALSLNVTAAAWWGAVS